MVMLTCRFLKHSVHNHFDLAGNSVLCRNEWAKKHALVHRSPFQLSRSAGQQISRSCYARSFASQPTASNKSKGSQVCPTVKIKAHTLTPQYINILSRLS